MIPAVLVKGIVGLPAVSDDCRWLCYVSFNNV